MQYFAAQSCKRISVIDGNVIIVNGTTDKIHDQRYYPLLASEILESSYLYMQTDESQRGRLIGKGTL